MPGDKSIAHRAVILGALSENNTAIFNFPFNKDCLETVSCLKKLGVKILLQKQKNSVVIMGSGLHGLKRPRGHIFIDESGTTFRLLLGVLAGQKFKVTVTAGNSLKKRPMLRVIKPLRLMGAQIKATVKRKGTGSAEEYPPITIKGGPISPLAYKMDVASAQVKSAILIAGLYSKGITKVTEPSKSRDHTERMLRSCNVRVSVKGNTVTLYPVKSFKFPKKLILPGDISSASFFIVLACLLSGSRLLIKGVGLNPSRMGVIKVLRRMGARIRITKNIPSGFQSPEPMGDIFINAGGLKATRITPDEIPSLIDELPVLMVAASLAKGETVIESVNELRVKETDRVMSMTCGLKAMKAEINVIKNKGVENITISGTKELQGASVRSFGDHRTAMSMVIAGLLAKGSTRIDDVSCISKSFPGFLRLLNQLIAK